MNLALAGGLVIIGLLHLLPLTFDMPFWFGFNHLAFLPAIHTYIFIIIAIVLVAFVLLPSTKIAEIAEKTFDGIAGTLFSENHYWRWILMAVLFVPLFWFLRLPINLLGDGYTIIHNIGDKYPVIFKWTERGAVALVYGVYKLLPGSGIEVARLAFSLISIICGGITVFFFAALSGQLSEDPRERLFFFLFLICSGWMLLFFGYVENYPPLWPVMTAYIFFALRYLKGKSGLSAATLLALVGIFLHLQTVFYLISWPFLIFASKKGQKYFRKYKIYIIAAGSIVTLILIAAFLHRYFTAIEFRVHFMPLITGRPKTPDYTVFSPSHLRDIFNLVFLLLPLWPIMIFAALKSRRGGKLDNIDTFLLSFTAGGFLLLFILDPRLGMGRDWDLYALTGLAPLLFMVRHSIRLLWDNPRTLIILPLFSLLLVYPFFAVGISRQPSIDYFKTLLAMRESESKPGMVLLRDFYRNEGQLDLADSITDVTRKRFPLDHMTRDIETKVKEGNYAEASRVADSVLKADPYNADSYNLKGAVFFYGEFYDSAAYYFKQSLRFRPYDHLGLMNLGFSQSRLGLLDESLETLRRAYKCRPDETLLLVTLAESFFRRKELDSTLFYSEEAIKCDSNYAVSYIAGGTAAFRLGQFKKAEVYLNRYLELKPNSIHREQVEKILGAIEQKKGK